MRTRRLKVSGIDATYHCMTRTVNGERLFGDRDKEVLRKMLWQVADFCGVEVLTYCVMSNHFHVLVRVPGPAKVSDRELMRRYKVLYPKPTKYQAASIAVMETTLSAGGEEAESIRKRLLARMGDVSEYMKTVKQRFSAWFNGSHGRYGTLWADRFKSVLVEGKGNPLQTMAAYIDLNPVRAGIVEDPRDYRFCGYAEAVAGGRPAREGLLRIWADQWCREDSDLKSYRMALRAHRDLILGKGAREPGQPAMSRANALRRLERGEGLLEKATILRCRIRYFTDGAILGSEAFVCSYEGVWQRLKERKHPPKPHFLRGADWRGLATIQGLRKQVFG